jgi:hypothetical protein
MFMTRRQKAIQAATRAAYDGRQAGSRREAAEWEALRRADHAYGATRGVRRPLHRA